MGLLNEIGVLVIQTLNDSSISPLSNFRRRKYWIPRRPARTMPVKLITELGTNRMMKFVTKPLSIPDRILVNIFQLEEIFQIIDRALRFIIIEIIEQMTTGFMRE